MKLSSLVSRAAVATVVTTTVAGIAAVASPAAVSAASQPAFKVRPAVAGHVQKVSRTAPLSTSDCLTQIGIHCYSPLQYRTAYNLNPLYARGITGKGRTIVIVDSFGSPTIQHDLEAFDAQFGLPNTTVQVVKAGNVPPFDPANPDHVGWAQETTLDVEYAHAVAPDAKIVLVETPVAETEGVTGLPEMMDAEKALIDQGVGDVISQSFGATENTFPGFDTGNFSSLLKLRYAYADAALHGVTVLAASGDAGATDYQANGEDLYPYPVNSWPSSDPLVTSIGGTQLNLDDSGKRVSPDVVWNDGYGAGGGGLSNVFPRPLFQTGVRNVVGNHRGTPDISMSSAVDGGAWVYYTFVGAASPWHIFGGTSEATPIFAGIVALADQQAGRRLGNINAALYILGAGSTNTHLPTGLVDVTSGDNSFEGVTGFPAGPGYDLGSGWGTIDANKFVPALALL
ncbi:S53 family peptidase [Dactylosporangium sp. NPDC051485]|uniref:S53 family peptidase n=1 Tax=Dactylosporangium sp. NPDC051485 TaxID=3154846 RepID=UPI0034333985